ncbi:MAG: hypothetical protein KGM43_03440 [Planctomycetota bacterium]|nr:hypothetical protein [Planctomycetota bacterium]
MGFDTMKDTDVQVRKTLNTFKWDDVVDVVDGQTLMNKSKVLEAVAEAKEANLESPYAKVGKIKKNLVFRIKHKKGHWGEADIVVVKDYVVPVAVDAVPVTKKALFRESKVKDELTVAWWTDTRKDEGDMKSLEPALRTYELTLKNLGGDPTPLDYKGLLSALDLVEKAAKSVQGVMQHKDDKAIMQNFLYALSKRQEEHEKAQNTVGLDYDRRMGAALDTIFDFASARNTNLENTLGQARGFVDRGDLSNANRMITKLTQLVVREGSPTTEKAMLQSVKDAAAVNKLDIRELMPFVLKDRRRQEIDRAYKALLPRIESIADEVEQLEATADQDHDHPDRAANQDPTYQKNLRDVNTGYKNVLAAIAGGTTFAKRHLTNAQRLVGLVATTTTPQTIPDFAGRIVDQLDQYKQGVVVQYAKIRNEEGSLREKVVADGITREDQAKFLTPILNRSMNVWYQYRKAEQEVHQALEDALDALVQRVPDLEDAAKPVRARLKTSGE